MKASLRSKVLVRTVMAALGFDAIFLLRIVAPAIDSEQSAIYHWAGPPWTFLLPIALDFLDVWLLLALLLFAARKAGRRRAVIWGGLLFLTPWFLGQTLQVFSLRPLPPGPAHALLLGGVLATAVLAAAWRPALAARMEPLIGASGSILSFAGLFGVFLLAQLAYRGWQARGFVSDPPLYAEKTATAKPHRIIWIVFDELSYQQTFDRRYPGLDLPAFDALAAASTTFTDAVPFAIMTKEVIPGLFTGEPYDQMRASPAAKLWLRNQLTGGWEIFNQHDTVFQDALNDGYSTAVSGWYNPYCRILPEVLDSCYWTFHPELGGMSPSNTVLENMAAPAEGLLRVGLRASPAGWRASLMRLLRIPDGSVQAAQGHIEDYQDLDARALGLLRDRSYGFVLLHLPVPHPNGIYDRRTGRFTTAGSSYINNLALADRCLAGIRRTLEESGQWESSTVVVMGDHSWRTKQIWYQPRIEDGWTEEDQLASHGGEYDPRPVYMVKLPGQTTAARVDSPYGTANTRKLFDAILAQRISTPNDLGAWAQALPAPR